MTPGAVQAMTGRGRLAPWTGEAVMKRAFVLAIGTVVAVMVLAGPALAKGPGEAPLGELLIAGPGLATPIQLEGHLAFGPFGEEMTAPDSNSRDLSAFVLGSGLIPSDTGYFGGEPEGDLGPRYSVTATIFGPDAATVRQDLYPFAKGGPLFFNPPGQEGFYGSRLASAWWYPPAQVMTILTRHGLPLTPPAIPAPAVKKVPGPILQPGDSKVWIALVVIGALTLLLVGGALAGKQRSMRAT
jgi:hypothetical protein